MECTYKIIEITTEEALKNALFSFSGDNRYFVYRGQADSNWTLKTSLERKFNTQTIRIALNLWNYHIVSNMDFII